MIYGNGLLATGFKFIDNPNIVFLCSGVSGSTVADTDGCWREYNLVKQIMGEHPDKTMVYTSSLDCGLKSTPYNNHKLQMEELVKGHPSHIIVRIGNIIYHRQSPWQFFPSILQQLKNGKVKIVKCRKNLLHLREYIDFVNLLISFGKSTATSYGAANPPFVDDIVRYLESKLGLQSVKGYCDGDDSFEVPKYIIADKNYYQKAIDLVLKNMAVLETSAS